jgi:selenocysteine lyase/cysteine desulfurase
MTASSQTLPTIDVAALRRHFPQLADRTAYFDGPGGTQTPDVVADAVRDALLAPLSNRGSATQAARNADAIVRAGREAMGDLLGVAPSTVVFGRSATELTFSLARTLARGWGPGDEVVVTRLDHDANIRPWVLAAEAVGATVRWAPFDPQTGELHPDDVAALVGERTRLVAVTGRPTCSAPARTCRPSPPSPTPSVPWCTWTACTSPRTRPSTSPPRGRTPSSARRTSSSGRTAGC